jgi:glycosyltransferase involved in cell wall biosynthesis
MANNRVRCNPVIAAVSKLLVRIDASCHQRFKPESCRISGLVDAFVSYCPPPDLDEENLRHADLVIFHALLSASSYLRRRRRNGPRVAVMPHSPTPITGEMACFFNPETRPDELASDQRFRSLLKEEYRLYSLADRIVAPCSAALDAYRSISPAWAEVFDDSRLATCYTGTPPPAIHAGKEIWRQRLGIKDGQLLAVYVGRYHFHKGYDLLAPVMREVNRQLPGRITLACAGGETVESTDGIVHVGFTNDVGGLMSAADFVVVPCRYAYFDLSALECCALGRPMLITDVGGHRELGQMVPAMRTVAPTIDALVGGFIEMANDADIEIRGKAILEAYNRLFTPQAFAGNHIRLYQKLLE